MRENEITARTDFPRGGKPKNAENHSSLVSEMQKMPKTAFRLQATSEKRGKWPIARERNAENAKTSEKRGKWGFGAARKVEIRKNNVSGCPDELFLEKMNRRGVLKLGKFEKWVLGVPRKGQM